MYSFNKKKGKEQGKGEDEKENRRFTILVMTVT